MMTRSIVTVFELWAFKIWVRIRAEREIPRPLPPPHPRNHPLYIGLVVSIRYSGSGSSDSFDVEGILLARESVITLSSCVGFRRVFRHLIRRKVLYIVLLSSLFRALWRGIVTEFVDGRVLIRRLTLCRSWIQHLSSWNGSRDILVELKLNYTFTYFRRCFVSSLSSDDISGVLVACFSE